MTPLPSHRSPLALVALLFLGAAGLGGCDTPPGPPLPPPNAAPTLRILRPEGTAPLRVGQPVDVEARVEDAEDGEALGERVLWVSSLEGQLTRGVRASATFREAGDQTLTATVMDSGGQVTSASVRVSVLGTGAPVATVLKPAPGSAFNLGEPAELACEAVTVGGVRLTGSAVSWTSALTGPLPHGDAVRAALRVS
ncbi:hypothetical protein ACLESD_09510, partial [Pyxidicoccus sp. 3LFB2]